MSAHSVPTVHSLLRLTDASALNDSPYWRLVVLDEYTREGFRLSSGLKGELMRGQRVTRFTNGFAPLHEGDRCGYHSDDGQYGQPGNRHTPQPPELALLTQVITC